MRKSFMNDPAGGRSILGDTYGTDHAYKYVVDLISYTAEDFMRDNMTVFVFIILIAVLALTGFAVRRYMNLQRAAQKEAERNARLQEALEKARLVTGDCLRHL